MNIFLQQLNKIKSGGDVKMIPEEIKEKFCSILRQHGRAAAKLYARLVYKNLFQESQPNKIQEFVEELFSFSIQKFGEA